MRNRLLILLALFAGILGCNPPPADPDPSLQTGSTLVAGARGTLEKTTATIQQNATTGESKTPAAAAPTLNQYWRAISTAAGQQESAIDQLKQSEVQLAAAQKLFVDRESQHQKTEAALRDDIAKLKSADDQAARVGLAWLIGSCIIGIMVSVFAIVYGEPKWGGCGLAMFGTGLGVSLVLRESLPEQRIIAPIVLVAVIVLVCVIAYKKYKTSVAAVAVADLTAKPEAQDVAAHPFSKTTFVRSLVTPSVLRDVVQVRAKVRKLTAAM